MPKIECSWRQKSPGKQSESRHFLVRTLHTRGAAITGGAATVVVRGEDATNRGCPRMCAACERKDECSLLRDQTIKPMSLATTATAATKLLNIGHQASETNGFVPPGDIPRNRSPDMTSPATMYPP